MSAAFELPALEPTAVVLSADLRDPVAAAMAEAEGLRAQAQAEGYAAGIQNGAAEVSAAVTALHAALAGLGDERAEAAARYEEAATELAFAIAEQVLGAALELQPERVVEAVRGALRRLVEREHVTVLVHPDDLDIVRAAAPGLLVELGGIEHCEVQAERRVARGGAVVRTAEGEIDVTLKTKLAKVREVVVEAMADGPR